ncbi:MAG: hypothetical protein HC817_01065 [Saprospiraceae bacterium]|nr:hypothetical protein [Saprospiraceae bacterium]
MSEIYNKILSVANNNNNKSHKNLTYYGRLFLKIGTFCSSVVPLLWAAHGIV